MRTLDRALADKDAIGQPIKLPWFVLQKMVQVRTKELVIVAGAPGGGKSTLAVNLAIKSGFPCVYFAQDSPTSVLARSVAIAKTRTTKTVYDSLASEDGRRKLVDEMRGVRPTLMIERGAVQADRVESCIVALREWLGEAPPLIIIDNLIDMLVPGYSSSDVGFYSTVLPQLKQMALKRDVCIMALHHVVKGGDQALGTGRIRMGDLLYAGDREARHVWGVYHDSISTMNVQILKQQDGPADPHGGLEVRFRWTPEIGNVTSMEWS